ncbi:MAG: sulfotransferase [Congregibacter sp.]
MTKQRFFIIGAPKCGTTALYSFLSAHPSIFMPALKEPHFYSTDLPIMQQITERHKYLDIFSDAAPEEYLIGEASAWYFYSKVAIDAILEDFPGAKFIFLVRNPVDMIASLHSQLLYTFKESEHSVFRAVSLQEDRLIGKNLPKNVLGGEHLQYVDLASFGRHVEEIVKKVGRGQLKLVFHEDLVSSARETYIDVLQFLGAPDDGRNTFPEINKARRHRYPKLTRLLARPPFPLNVIKSKLRSWLFSGKSTVMRPLYESLSVTEKSSSFSLKEKKVLLERLEQDVAKLSAFSGRDLSHWLSS